MAYSDYSQPQQQMFDPAKRLPNTGITGGMGTMGRIFGQQPQSPVPEQPQAPAGDPAPLPTNTRAGALQQVQNAYAGRMPGQMDALNSALGQFSSPVGLDDPGIAPAIRAGAGVDQRTLERGRAALAEQLGATGLGDSGALITQTQGLNQRIGEQGAQRDAGLVYDEMGSRRNALLSALGMDQQRYNVDNDLGLRLAMLEAQLNNQAVQPFF